MGLAALRRRLRSSENRPQWDYRIMFIVQARYLSDFAMLDLTESIRLPAQIGQTKASIT